MSVSHLKISDRKRSECSRLDDASFQSQPAAERPLQRFTAHDGPRIFLKFSFARLEPRYGRGGVVATKNLLLRLAKVVNNRFR